MNKPTAGNHREMIASLRQRHQFAPAIASRVVDFVRRDRNFVDSSAADSMYLPVQYGYAYGAARGLKRRALTPTIRDRVVLINPIHRITMTVRRESAHHVNLPF